MTQAPALPATGTSLFADPDGCWLLLSRLPRMGVRRWQAVKENLACPLELLAMDPATLRSLALPPEACDAIAAWQVADAGDATVAEAGRILSACRAKGISLIGWDSAQYPEALANIHDAPLLLYARGDTGLLQRPQIGIVGSRSATRGGLEHARQFAAALSESGFLVTSGLALGVDGAAHAGALDAGFPTAAVVGTGLDVIYPRQHSKLTEDIASQGVIVSDLPPGTPARPAHFPQRNRIISGLSRGVLVIEASPRSGSLITARLALEQGREVFAIPGSIHNPQARGCHQLIRQGATLVESVADIEAELSAWGVVQRPIRIRPKPERREDSVPKAPVSGDAASSSFAESNLAAREIVVLKALGYDPASTDQLCATTALPAEELMQSLLLLEMEGLVTPTPGGFQRLA
ncbi:DNA-processing protein DprA [Marinobacter salicampi]|uniref:DNA-processing protein DprA n=1 Tax=Marinobacter salicampi TaxID=435907 RepID=UPI00140D4C36|nr:DNA-processing protein DprA [Marinobacter salicampi]